MTGTDLEEERPARPLPILGWIGRNLAAERERWPLWIPVAAGLGVALYFSAPLEPATWIGPCLLTALIHLTLWVRHRQRLAVLVVAITAIVAGFASAQIRSAVVATPMLSREIGPTEVEGTVTVRDILPNGRTRVVLDRPTVDRLRPAEVPRRIRVSLLPGHAPAPVGARVRVLAILYGPSGPVAPGAFDFRRRAYFQGIGAIGYAVGAIEIRSGPAADAAVPLEALRESLAERIRGAFSEADRAALAAALLVGERAAVSDDVYEALRESGLAHLLAISGLHVGLIAGLVFFAVRLLLAAVEPLALRYPIKKWAALCGLLAALGYTVLVGAPVPTQRAFVMTGLVFLAVLVDRTAISMRLVAWAAVVVFVLTPESIVGASFQLSFAAVIALVAAYENAARRAVRRNALPVALITAATYVGGVALTTLVASTATAPFALFHFQRIATFGIAANLLAVPLTAFWIMPWGLVSYLVMPLGLEGWALQPMGWGIDLLLRIAREAASWPGAVWLLPAMPLAGLIAITLGGLWLCLWQRTWRLLGLLGIVGGMLSLAIATPPDVLVSDDGRLIAIRTGTGSLAFSSISRESFVRQIWQRRDGSRAAPVAWPASGSLAGSGLTCDPRACLYERSGWRVSIVADPRAFEDDCRRVDIVVSPAVVPETCLAVLGIGFRELRERGAHALYLSDGTVRVKTGLAGERPWTPSR